MEIILNIKIKSMIRILPIIILSFLCFKVSSLKAQTISGTLGLNMGFNHPIFFNYQSKEIQPVLGGTVSLQFKLSPKVPLRFSGLTGVLLNSQKYNANFFQYLQNSFNIPVNLSVDYYKTIKDFELYIGLLGGAYINYSQVSSNIPNIENGKSKSNYFGTGFRLGFEHFWGEKVGLTVDITNHFVFINNSAMSYYFVPTIGGVFKLKKGKETKKDPLD